MSWKSRARRNAGSKASGSLSATDANSRSENVRPMTAACVMIPRSFSANGRSRLEQCRAHAGRNLPSAIAAIGGFLNRVFQQLFGEKRIAFACKRDRPAAPGVTEIPKALRR